MSSTYSNIKVELIGTGDQSGTWGDTTNVNLGTALEEAIVGRANPNFTSDANLTISLVDTNATQIARNYILNVTSSVSLTATRNLVVPTINKPYIVENNTSGSQSIVVKTSAGTGITVPNGKTVMVYANGTNVVSAFDYAASMQFGTASATGGFTGNLTGNVTGNVSGNAGTVTDGVYLTSTQTLTNKTISADSNTLSGIAASSFVLSNASGNIDGSASQKAIPSGTVVGTTDTQTLTNKRVTPRVNASTANSATPTLNTDTTDIMVITGQSVAITSFTTNLTGTPTNGQKLWIAITGTTSIAITWGTSFEASTIALPTTTVSTNRLDIGFVWNATTSKWRCIGAA